MKLAVGTTLQNGKYAVTNILGQSDLSITLKATQAYLNQTVVLKTLKPNSQIPIDWVQLKQRFSEDARRFARCQHPGLVRLLDFFEEEDLPFAVMDFISGQSLAERVKEHGALPEAQALQYIRQVGSALSVVHKHGLVHKSVEPANLVRPAGTDFAVLVDYGILDWAALPGSGDSIQPANDPYRAIECYQPSVALTPATDIYALAATLYFLLTGHPPTPATLQEQSPLTAPRKLQPGISEAVEAAILSGMAARPQARPQTIAAWFAQLPGADLLPPVQMPKGTVLPDLQPAAAVSYGKTQATVSNGKTQAVVPSAPTNPALIVGAQRSLPTAPPPFRKSRLPKVLIGTATIAVLAGLGLGLVLRLGAVTGIGPKIFHTQQNFPPLPNWDGAAEPVAAPAVDLPPINPPRLRAEQTVAPKPKPTPTPASTPVAQPSPKSTIEALPDPTGSQTMPFASPTPVPPVQVNSPLQPEPELPPPNTSGVPATKPGEAPTKAVEGKKPLGQ